MSIDKTFLIKAVASSQVLLPEITNTDVSVVENSSTDTPLLTIAHGPTDKSIDDFKRSAGSGESQGSSSIYIGSTESSQAGIKIFST
jgi:hypothetical protein